MISAEPKAGYSPLQEKIKKLLVKNLKMRAMSQADAVAFLLVFSQIGDRENLGEYCELFSGTFPFLKEITEESKAFIKTAIEQKIRLALDKIIKKDPVLATKIAKEAILPGITWEELVSKYPDLKQ
jgi:hypothetical protein